MRTSAIEMRPPIGSRTGAIRGAALVVLPALAAILIWAPTSASALSASCPNENTVINASNTASAETSLVCLVNTYRQDSGLNALARDGRLDLASRRHSQDMVNRDYFDHTAPAPAPYGADPWDRAAAAGFPTSQGFDISENIACADPATPMEIFESWRTSSAHNSNMLRAKWVLTGMGIVADAPTDCGGSGATATNMFSIAAAGGGGGGDCGDEKAALDAAKRKVAKAKRAVKRARAAKRRADTRRERKRAARKLKRKKAALRRALAAKRDAQQALEDCRNA